MNVHRQPTPHSRRRDLWPLAIAAALALTTLPSCSDETSEGADVGLDSGADSSDQSAALTGVSPSALNSELQHKDFLLINVHIPDAGEIAGTDVHIAYTEIDALVEYIGADLDVSVVLYCLTDHMALIAGGELVDRGYRMIRYLEGGMQAWENAGYSIDGD